MYDAIGDPYCYPGTTVLRNRAGLRTQKALDRYEAAMTTQRADEPLPFGRLSVSHYRAIHHHLFQDIYPWAGRFRTVRIGRGGSAFCYPENISRQMRSLFQSLAHRTYLQGLSRETFAVEAAAFLATLNAIHPFREGNGRTQTTFLTLLADQAGHPIDLDRLKPKPFLNAMIASFRGNEQNLVRQILRLAGQNAATRPHKYG
jgi:cell filamentation protein